MPEPVGRSLDHDAVAALKHLALVGAFDGEAKLSSSELATHLETSTQTASRRLKRVDETGHVEREIVSDGQWVQLTEAGRRRLRTEYDAYRRIFESPAAVELQGIVTSGMGEGRHYVTLPGYERQFRERLGYEPFPGTFNVDLNAESVRERARLGGLAPTEIDGWEDEERTYGPAYCYPAAVAAGGQAVEDAHVIAPERTHHGEDQLEVIAPVKLRDELGLEDDDEVTVRVSE